MMEAVLSNADHPEYGVATIPLPIPRNQYDHCVALLEALEIGESDIAAAGGDGFGRLVNTVQFRLDAGKLDGLEVKSAGIKLPDHPAPDILIRREEKQRGQITA